MRESDGVRGSGSATRPSRPCCWPVAARFIMMRSAICQGVADPRCVVEARLHTWWVGLQVMRSRLTRDPGCHAGSYVIARRSGAGVGLGSGRVLRHGGGVCRAETFLGEASIMLHASGFCRSLFSVDCLQRCTHVKVSTPHVMIHYRSLRLIHLTRSILVLCGRSRSPCKILFMYHPHLRLPYSKDSTASSMKSDVS